MRTDYQARAEIDARYRSRRAAGQPGWRDDYAESIARVEEVVTRYQPGREAMLEMGCGAGNVALAVAAKGLFMHVHGIDLSEEAIDWARAKAVEAGLTADFRVGSVVDLGCYGDGWFDLVVDSSCLHMVIGDDRVRCLASVHRVLRPGGLFCVSAQCRNPEVAARYVVTENIHFDPESELLLRDGLPYYHLRLRQEVLGELTATGFEVLDWRMRPEDDDEGPYILGCLLANAVKRGEPAEASGAREP
jgi:SAM-dependent methyltransferase